MATYSVGLQVALPSELARFWMEFIDWIRRARKFYGRFLKTLASSALILISILYRGV